MSSYGCADEVLEGSAPGGAERSGGERSESERSAALPGAEVVPDPEVCARPKRRRFTAAYKARIVEQVEACAEPGAVGALLRREGLYSSLLSKWREQYRSGALAALADDSRGRKRTKNPLADEVARLARENARLARRLEQAEAIIEIQKKMSEVLGIAPANEPNEGSD